MNKLNSHIFLIISILTLSFLSSCGALVKSQSNKLITEDKGAIPPKFGKEKTTILFVTHDKRYNKNLKKNVNEAYKGDFEYITSIEYESNSKFQDVVKYRYVFDYEYKHVYIDGFGSFKSMSGKVLEFSILDRKDLKLYVSKMTASNWNKVQKIYLEKLTDKLMSEYN